MNPHPDSKWNQPGPAQVNHRTPPSPRGTAAADPPEGGPMESDLLPPSSEVLITSSSVFSPPLHQSEDHGRCAVALTLGRLRRLYC